jgi:hypothetical protein
MVNDIVSLEFCANIVKNRLLDFRISSPNGGNMKVRSSLFLAAFSLAVFGGAAAAQADAREMTVYKSPQCGCCGDWIAYMRDAGYAVRVKEMEDVIPIKEFLRINEDLWSCHTAVVDGVAVEGHVSLDAMARFLAQRPEGARGIALPGMPQGSPGMSGVKEEDFVTYTISDGEPEVFLVE